MRSMANPESPRQLETGVASPRVDDQQRAAALDELSAAAAIGRLSSEEFEERAELALRAQTHADLELLLKDLGAPEAAAVRRGGPVVVALTGADLTKAILFVIVTGAVAWFVGGYAWPYQYGQRLLLWLFGLVCGAAGAALRRRD